MKKWYEYLIAIGLVGTTAFGGWRVYGELTKPKDEAIPNEPFAAGNLDIHRDGGSLEGSNTSLGGAGPIGPGSSIGYSNTEKLITVPLDSESEFVARIGPGTKEVVVSSPFLLVQDDGSAILDGLQEVVVNRSGTGGPVQQTVWIDKTGMRYNSEQELLDAFIRASATPEILAKVGGVDDYSVITGIREGKPVNVTNIITSRPEGFPEAKPEAISKAFQTRARALEATLTISNPGGSSSAALPNFSRLAAVGTDLSNIDLYSVRNPNFLGQIKSGGGKLTDAQRILVDQARLAIDPRNITSSEQQEILRNQQIRQAEKAVLDARAKQLRASGYNEANAIASLRAQGVNVTGSLSAEQFASLERRLGPVATKLCLNCKVGQVAPTVKPTSTNLTQCLNDKRKLFLRQTGRQDFFRLTQAEIATWNRLIAGCK
jgi:hypothetical protein